MRRHHTSTVVFLLVCPGLCGTYATRAETTPSPDHRYLFITDEHIRHIHQLERVVNQPSKLSDNPVIKPEHPWESRYVHHAGTVTYDEQEGFFKYWYTSGTDPNVELTYEGGSYPRGASVVCYATSQDGIHWKKPNLGQVQCDDSRDNNILKLGKYSPQGVAVLDDPKDPDPQQRYKAIYWDHVPMKLREQGIGGDLDGTWVAFSPDGIHWKDYQHNPVLRGYNDCDLCIVQDPLSSRYLAYGRFGFNRTVACTTSSDFLNWSTPRQVLEPDRQELSGPWPLTQFYGMTVDMYEGLYLGCLKIYRPGSDGRIDSQLAASHDGVHWQRVGNRQTFLPLGAPNQWDDGMVRTAQHYITRGNQLYLYYGMVSGPHAGALYPDKNIQRRWPNAIGLALLRRDGFVSLDAKEQRGSLLTKPIMLDGRQLHLNVNVEAGGEARVVVCNPWASLEDFHATRENDIPQYGQPGHNDYNHDDDGRVLISQASDPITGDHVDVVVKFPDTSLARLAGKVAALRIELSKAKLYSFYFK
jgi:hypothetical protein